MRPFLSTLSEAFAILSFMVGLALVLAVLEGPPPAHHKFTNRIAVEQGAGQGRELP